MKSTKLGSLIGLILGILFASVFIYVGVNSLLSQQGMGGFIFIGFGIVLLLIFALIFVSTTKKRKINAWLNVNGSHISADITDIKKIINRNPQSDSRIGNTAFANSTVVGWSIKAQIQNPSDGKIYQFSSELIPYDPTQYLVSQKIDILVNPNDYKQYRVSTEGLPKVA